MPTTTYASAVDRSPGGCVCSSAVVGNSASASVPRSEALHAFINECPLERRPILSFVQRAANELGRGAVVLDVGAGDAPYRELFNHCEYITSDWAGSQHEAAAGVSLVAEAHRIPLDSASVDAILMTQVLEHLPEPQRALDEAARLLRPSGKIYVSVPFVWELHEVPFDFWRFTPFSLERLLRAAGFDDIAISPRNDCFATLAQLLQNVGAAMGRAPDGRDEERIQAGELLSDLAEQLSSLGELDVAGLLPLGWTATGHRA
jgi:SAM-dependent methyltransferase